MTGSRSSAEALGARTRAPHDGTTAQNEAGSTAQRLHNLQGFNPVLFSSYLGYPNDEDDVVEVGASGAFIKTPNVVAVAREHFDCDDMPGALLENFGGQGTAGGHWEERLFAVRTANSHPRVRGASLLPPPTCLQPARKVQGIPQKHKQASHKTHPRSLEWHNSISLSHQRPAHNA